MAGWTYGKKREEWVIEFASQKQILRIVEQTKHQFCLRFYPVHPFFPLFSISPSPSADWPPGTLCGRYQVVGKTCGRRVVGKGLLRGKWWDKVVCLVGEELEKRGKYLTGGERKGSRGNFNCFES